MDKLELSMMSLEVRPLTAATLATLWLEVKRAHVRTMALGLDLLLRALELSALVFLAQPTDKSASPLVWL